MLPVAVILKSLGCCVTPASAQAYFSFVITVVMSEVLTVPYLKSPVRSFKLEEIEPPRALSSSDHSGSKIPIYTIFFVTFGLIEKSLAN